jgi:hypothetical protein
MVTLGLAVGACLAAYGFLGAYALKAWQQEQLSVHQAHLRMLQQQRQEIVRKSAILKRAAQFTARARELNLQPDDWALYDVNVASPLNFEAAQEIIYLCSDSELTYYWPISLEIKLQGTEDRKTGTTNQNTVKPTDVQLSVQGRFAARRR